MKLNRILAMLIALLLLLAVPALCEGEGDTDWEAVRQEGWTHYENKDYAKALELWLSIPQDSLDSAALNNIGWMYNNGYGTEEDDVKALEWFLVAYEKGSKAAPANAAYLYFIAQDYENAFKYYTVSNVDNLNGSDANRIGWMYDHGEGTEEDDTKALEWFLIGHEKGSQSATSNAALMYYHAKQYSESFNLYIQCDVESLTGFGATCIGWMYDTGNGTEENDTKALEWYLIGHEKGNKTATCNAALMYYNAENYDEAFKFYALCDVEDLSGSDANRIGWMYGTGNGVERDDTKALEWYLIGHEKGNKTATVNVGNKYYAARNYVEAFKYYSLCEIEDLGSYAALALGDMYDNGFGVESDLNKAIELYNHAHQLGSIKGTIELGYAYYEIQDYASAHEIWTSLPDENMTEHIAANLGWMYDTGKGTEKNLLEAIKWYEYSAARENAFAMCKLAWHYYFGQNDADGNTILEPNYELAWQYAHKAIVDMGVVNVEGLRVLAEIYRNGHDIVDPDNETAIELYLQAAQNGNYFCYSQVGHIQFYSLEDYDEAAKNIELYLDFATEEEERENAWVFNVLGRVYGDLGTNPDPDKCLIYSSRGANHGNSWCMYTLGYYYLYGWGGSVDYELARLWYSRGVDAGNSRCMTCMGDLYANGWGVTKDVSTARMWYEKALEAGDEGAQAKLDALPQ